VTQENFFGTGSRVGLSVNTSSANTVFDYTYDNPYYTVDGVSRGFRVFYRKTDADELNITSANVDSYGASMNFGLPLSEANRLRFEFEYKNTDLELGTNPRSDLVDFVAENGNNYDTFTVIASWSDDTRDSALFPTRGGRQRLFGEIALPVFDLTYYSAGYDHAHYWPLAEALTFKADGNVNYGDGYGDTEQLPPFEKFFAGGLNCVRGWEENTLGPRDPATGDPLGGNLRACGTLEMITPVTYEDIKSIRLAGFFDIGNVFDTINGDGFETDELRYSTGVALNWLSPIGPLTFSYAFPLNDEAGDETQNFQFRIGGSF
jgi:outer membrane protein insertion porin family